MKLLTIIAAVALLLLSSESIAEKPVQLQAIQVQDLSQGSRDAARRPPRFVRTLPIRQTGPIRQTSAAVQESSSQPEDLPVSEDRQAETESNTKPDWDSELLDEKNQQDERSTAQTRSRAAGAYLQELMKPVRTIQLSAGINRSQVPDNQAASLIKTDKPILITNSGTVSLPDRYTVCITYRPLYYEDANLERCGNGHGIWQPAYSGFKFLATTLVLPYKMGRQCPIAEVRCPGDCKTCQSFPTTLEMIRKTPLSGRGLVNEMAALAGFTFLVL